MQVKVRHIENAEGVHFHDAESHEELESLVAFINRVGGFYDGERHAQVDSYQFVLDGNEAYAEIIIGQGGD